ncbi:VanZ family protein [Lederbergia citrea]|uniref:VanZ family protein n=1 Tax=Lederbergia citrea TaxID=2833581 RepID=A0A942UHY9_9BACI|nr:VanZ family protein [Lederbergia citrea]MBS4203543.1 VanZ family protein [Lederbergia citrea]MBS4221800.1 VanZ family protein [Lederbergia citrea]
MKIVIKVALSISFILYLFALMIILFLGSRGFQLSDLSMLEYIRYSSNFVPFKTINTYFNAIFDGSMNMDIPIKNLGGNFILFLPMGIYLPFFIKKINNVSIFSISMITVLFVIEVLQLVTRRGSFDIDDLILNMLGALIGYGIWKTKFVQNKLQNRTTLTIFN